MVASGARVEDRPELLAEAGTIDAERVRGDLDDHALSDSDEQPGGSQEAPPVKLRLGAASRDAVRPGC
jgi:hypothetical protein